MERLFVPTINRYLARKELKHYIFSKFGKAVREKNIIKEKRKIIFVKLNQNTSILSEEYIKNIFMKSRKDVEFIQASCLENLNFNENFIYILPISQEIIILLIIFCFLDNPLKEILRKENIVLISKYVSEIEASILLNLKEKYDVFCDNNNKFLLSKFLEIFKRNPKYVKSAGRLLKFLNLFFC